MSHLIEPHGGKLIDLMVSPERRDELRELSREIPSWDLTPRQLCDLEILMTGGFSPLDGFMTKKDADSVASRMRLASGTLWPMPITLDVTEPLAARLQPGGLLALRDPEGVMLAVLNVEDQWPHDRKAESEAVYGTNDETHPGVAHLVRPHQQHRGRRTGRRSGHAVALRLPALRRTPAELRHEFEVLGWRKIVAFQTRNPMHRAHFELTHQAAKSVEANLLIHPAVGMTKPGDLDHYTRVRCYQELLRYYPRQTALLAAADRDADGRAARSDVAPSSARTTAAPTSSSAATRRPRRRQQGQAVLRSVRRAGDRAQAPGRAGHPDGAVPEHGLSRERGPLRSGRRHPGGGRTLNISGTDLRRRLAEGREIPTWFTFPEVATELRRTHPRPRGASPCSSPASPAPASRPSRRRSWSSCSRWAAGR